MSLCSAHKTKQPGCELCSSMPEDLFGKAAWAKMKAEAEAAGLHDCGCGFTYYKTTKICPLCNAPRQETNVERR